MLQDARDALSNNYVGTIKQSFAEYEYMYRITGEEKENLVVTSTLDVQIEQYGQARELAHFRAGQSDIVTLCMIMALVDALFKKVKPFIILDDPFVNLDDIYTKRALKLLESIGTDHQVIYLVRNDKNVLRFIETFIQSTTPSGTQSTEPFWTKSETALLQAFVLCLLHEVPPEEQNFPMVMEMLSAREVREEEEEYESPLDILFARLELCDPESIAVKQYHMFKTGAGKILKSILISVAVRLSVFNLSQIARLTCTDDLHLEEMGERKVAL